MILKFIGKAYNGFDPETNATIRVVGGQSVEVSETKAAQLLKDYPKDWIESEKKEKSSKEKEKSVEKKIPEIEHEEEVEVVEDPVEEVEEIKEVKPKKKVKGKKRK